MDHRGPGEHPVEVEQAVAVTRIRQPQHELNPSTRPVRRPNWAAAIRRTAGPGGVSESGAVDQRATALMTQEKLTVEGDAGCGADCPGSCCSARRLVDRPGLTWWGTGGMTGNKLLRSAVVATGHRPARHRRGKRRAGGCPSVSSRHSSVPASRSRTAQGRVLSSNSAQVDRPRCPDATPTNRPTGVPEEQDVVAGQPTPPPVPVVFPLLHAYSRTRVRFVNVTHQPDRSAGPDTLIAEGPRPNG
jgi:hypothetical protein